MVAGHGGAIGLSASSRRRATLDLPDAIEKSIESALKV